eukprot:1464655-Amphidinium_carterae.1
MSKDQLLSQAPWRIRRVMATARSFGEAEDKIVMAETDKEVEKEWASGPFSKHDLDATFGLDRWIPAR